MINDHLLVAIKHRTHKFFVSYKNIFVAWIFCIDFFCDSILEIYIDSETTRPHLSTSYYSHSPLFVRKLLSKGYGQYSRRGFNGIYISLESKDLLHQFFFCFLRNKVSSMFVINCKLWRFGKQEQENFLLCQGFSFSFDGSWKNIDAFFVKRLKKFSKKVYVSDVA